MSELETLLNLQAVDTTIDQLEHRLATLPESESLAAATRELTALQAELAERTEAAAVVSREQKRWEDEVATVAAKVADVADRLYSSSMTSPKEAETLQADLDSLRRRQGELEDLVLEQMEAADPIATEIAVLEGRVAVAVKQREAAELAFHAAAGSVGQELAQAKGERAGLAAAVATEALVTYDAMRQRFGGVAIARLVGPRCGGCHLEIPPGELAPLQRAPQGEVVFCPECGRMLVR